MTDRLYYRDAALLEFDATVVEHRGDALHVVLDRTAFYPTSGGQPHDVGTLGGARVIDVVDDDMHIVHVLDKPIATGLVHGVVDRERRRDHMQQHTAQHLLSALAADRLKWETASVHFGAEHSTIEFATASASEKQLADLERWGNATVMEGRDVLVRFEDAVAAATAGLRKPSDRSGEIRVISIEGIDRSACGGTHVSRTSEIGAILLTGVEKIRGHARVGFLAGDRVIARAHHSDEVLGALAATMGCAVNQLDANVAGKQNELKTLRDQVATLEQEVALSRVRALRDGAAVDAAGRRTISIQVDGSPALLRAMAQAIGGLERTIFVAVAPTPPTIYFATSGDSGMDAGALLKSALAAKGGRGGGGARVAQGTTGSVDALHQIAEQLIA